MRRLPRATRVERAGSASNPSRVERRFKLMSTEIRCGRHDSRQKSPPVRQRELTSMERNAKDVASALGPSSFAPFRARCGVSHRPGTDASTAVLPCSSAGASAGAGGSATAAGSLDKLAIRLLITSSLALSAILLASTSEARRALLVAQFTSALRSSLSTASSAVITVAEHEPAQRRAACSHGVFVKTTRY